MRYLLSLLFIVTSSLSSFAQLDTALAAKLTIDKFCLCKTTLQELQAMDSNFKKIELVEMATCNDGFVEDSRFENGIGYASTKYPGIIFQKDDRRELISKFRLTKDFVGKLPDGNSINMKNMLAKDVIQLYPGFNTWGSRGCSDYWTLGNDTLVFFVKIDKTKQPQYPVDEAYYLNRQVEGADLVMSCYAALNKNETLQLFDDSQPILFVDSIRTNMAFIKEVYEPTDIALISVYKDSSATRLLGREAKNGVVYITTKSFARDKYWEYFKSKSAEYATRVPDMGKETTIQYLLNGKALTENQEGSLFTINDENFVTLRFIDRKQLKKDYNIADKKLGVLIETKTKQ